MTKTLDYASKVPTPITYGATIPFSLTSAGQGIVPVGVNAISIGSQNKEVSLNSGDNMDALME